MLIELKKFGTILTSREAGREALSAFLPTLHSLGENEKITIDFQGVSVLTPSWADEFIRPIFEKYGEQVSLLHDTNPSVQSALRFANPKLNLSKITVLADVMVFDEVTDASPFLLTFPYSDAHALRILTKNTIKKISVHRGDDLSDVRLKSVIHLLHEAGIKTVIAQ
ncbi:STAS-like domain-containing protein [Candidatus Peregrinibacteria bacterium]|nr:STAS-like domain-containing protein [Candidatus Peregrinibacteria bacterium]